MAYLVDREFLHSIDSHIKYTAVSLFHHHIGTEFIHEPISHTESLFFVASTAAIKNMNVHLHYPFDFDCQIVAIELSGVNPFASTH